MQEDRTLIRLLRRGELTAETEIDCTTCLELVPAYVDHELAGADVARGMPDLQRHLALCRDCHEEYEALHDLVQLDAGDGLPDRATLLERLDQG